MKAHFSISTVAYSGYSIDMALESIRSLGVYNIELALIQGAVYYLDEDSVSESYVCYVRELLKKKQMHCTSLAAHCCMTLDNCNELLLKRVNLAGLLDCPRLIFYAPRDANIEEFQQAAHQAISRAEELGVKILIENVGDRLPYMLNDSDDFHSVMSAYKSDAMGINFDPGNLVSHRPDNDLLQDCIRSLDVAEHLHIKDLQLESDGYHTCAVGEGVCRYPELLRYIAKGKTLPFFSIEAPFSLIRKKDGKTELKSKNKLLSIDEIERRLESSIDLILETLQFSAEPTDIGELAQ